MLLPIELISFGAQYGKEQSADKSPAVLLTWITASEENNDYFTIERSADGVNFKEIDRIAGKQTSSAYSHYQRYDHNPLPNTSYYRLKQTDLDGAFSYSKIVAVTVPPTDIDFLTVIPNPSNGQEISFYFAYSNSLFIEITDIFGKPINKNSHSLEVTTSHAVLSFYPVLAKGVYLAKIRLDTREVTRKIVVH